jgi:hypothetical protein
MSSDATLDKPIKSYDFDTKTYDSSSENYDFAARNYDFDANKKLDYNYSFNNKK